MWGSWAIVSGLAHRGRLVVKSTSSRRPRCPGNIVLKALPAVMIVASLGLLVFLFTAGRRNPLTIALGATTVVGTLGMMAGGGGKGGGAKRAEMDEDREDYLRYLGQMRDRAREAMVDQRAALEWVHPEPQSLWSLGASRRMWERRQNHSDFLHLRVGRSSHRLATRLVPPQTGPVDELEPMSTLALRRFVRAHSIVPDLPAQIALRGFAAVCLQGGAGHRSRRRGHASAQVVSARHVSIAEPY